MVKDRKGSTFFKRKKRLLPRSGGKDEVRVGFPLVLEEKRRETGWLPITGVLLEDSIIFFDYAGWSAVICPFCEHEFPPEDIIGSDSWTCVCGASISHGVSDAFTIQPHYIHNFDPSTGLVVSSLPEEAGKVAPETGLTTLTCSKE